MLYGTEAVGGASWFLFHTVLWNDVVCPKKALRFPAVSSFNVCSLWPHTAAQFSCEMEADKTEKEITSNNIITALRQVPVQHRRCS